MRKNSARFKKRIKPLIGFGIFLGVLGLAFPQFPLKFFALGNDFSSVNVVFLRSPVLDSEDKSEDPKYAELPQETMLVLQRILATRLKILGYENAQVSFKQNFSQLEVRIFGEEELDKNVAQVLTQKGRIIFRQLKEDVSWDENNLQLYYLNPDVWEDTSLTSADILGAVRHETDIQLILSEEGHKKFKEITLENVDKPLGIFVDDSPMPLALPVVTEELANLEEEINPVIEGSLDEDGAKVLEAQINGGVLPVSLEIGTDSVKYDPLLTLDLVYKVLIYVAIGLGAVFLALFILFRISAVISAIYFIFYVLLLGAIIRVLQIPLSSHIFIVSAVFLALTLARIVFVLHRLRRNLKKDKPANLAIFQSVFYKSTLVNRILGILFAVSVIGYFVEFLSVKPTFLVAFVGTVAYFSTYRYFFYPLLLLFKKNLKK